MNRLTMKKIQSHRVPIGATTIWWLGQAGFMLKSPEGIVLALDPYLSNSCKAIGDKHGFRMDRQVPPVMRARDLVGIDLYLITHSHQDHLDPETIGPYRKAGGEGLFVAPPEAFERLRALGIPKAQSLMVWPNKTFTRGDVKVRVTFAIPFAGDDLTHVGYLVTIHGGPSLYFTGDTAYHDLLGEAMAPHRPDVLVTVINGAFRNLGPAEAAMLAKRLGVKVVIPCHHDLFLDNCQPPQMLHTNLKLQNMGHTYRLLNHGSPFNYTPE